MSNDREQMPSHDPVAGMGRGMLWLFWLLLLAGGTWLFSAMMDDPDHPNREPEARVTEEFAELRLASNRLGHYVVDGYIDGVPTTFLLDTGATAVVIPRDQARRIGLEEGVRIPVRTASGRDHAYRTRIDRLQLGPLELRDVEAAIAPGLEDTVLLGMTALSRIDMTQRDGVLVLTQRM